MQPFLRLIEREHCGILSIVANVLTRESTGDICVRLDGDITCLTPRWAEKLVKVFEEGPPDLGVVGPKQLGTDGRIHAMGDWILHPRGYHHVAAGAARDAITRSIEVDHVMGCFYCYRREVFDQLGGFDEDFLRGQTIDFGLRVRLKGWRCIAVPHIEFVHRHALRKQRSTKADSHEGIDMTLNVFDRKWGFSRIAPDLDVVRERYSGTPLLWNARVFGPADDWPPLHDFPVDINASEWVRYTQDESFRALVDSRVMIAREIIRHLPKSDAHPESAPRILHWFSRGGLLVHFLAKEGHEVIGVDPDSHVVALAGQIASHQQYPARPQFLTAPDRRTLPLDDGSLDAVLLFDCVERHGNPVGLFHEAHRALRTGGILAIVSPLRNSPLDHDGDALHRYRRHELRLQVEGTRRFMEYGKASDATAGDLIVLLAQSVVRKAEPSGDGDGEASGNGRSVEIKPAGSGILSSG